ncbi:MAG: response regulator [Spirochaetaceae bacterium]
MIIEKDSHNRLARRLLLYVVLCSVGFTFLVATVQLFGEYSSEVESIHDTMSYIENSYVPNIALSIYLVEDELIKVLLEGALHFKEIQYLEIQEKRGGEIVTRFAGKADAARDIVKEYQIKYRGSSGENISYGVLIVAASLDEVYQRLWKKSLDILVTTAMITFFTTMCVFLLIQFMITRHLKTISKYTHTLDLDKIGLKLTLNRKESVEIDELSQVVHSINTMQERLKNGITKRKQAEEEKINLQDQLQQSRKMDAIGQLAGGVAHDFNNMLTGIIGAAQLLQNPIRNLDEKGLAYVEMILDASNRASDLTTKLLAFGRKGKIISTSIDIHTIVDDTLALFNRSIDKKIRISASKNAEQSTVIGDNTALQNSLLNLGINASHAMPDGGELTIETRNIILNNNYCNSSPFDISEGNYIEITIRDTGNGITPDNINKIFEPFFTTKKQGEGTGLGLASVYGTIQDHHGVINVYSEIGIGTVFNLYLPCSDDVVKKNPMEKIVLEGAGQVLLVDDEELVRMTGKYTLEEMGYKVILAENGLEAIDIFEKNFHDIDLVILDMIMPKMNGTEAFEKMKKIDENCKIIISSGFTKDENLNELRKKGLTGFIQKPFRDYELSKLLSEILKINN